MELTRLRADGRLEYWCSTTHRYYVPSVVSPSPECVWTLCTECDTERRPLLFGRDAQPHCYPVEVAHAHQH